MKKTVVFTGGGTLGHVMPNLYLINELKDDYRCVYLGSSGIEKEKVYPMLTKDFFTIPSVKLVRGKILTNLKIPFVLVNSIFKSKKILKRLNPSVIFSKGGYVSLPVCIAAKMLKIPVIAHESDYSFGLANKIILSLCNNMCVNFKQLEDQNKKVIHTGAILDKAFDSKQKNQHIKLNESLPTILIVGGSLGSRAINDFIFKILDTLLLDFNIIHVTGKGNKKIYSYKNYNSMEMCNDMPSLYNIANFVIGRSGAGITSECFYKKLPMLLIPLENSASRGDQLQNAKYYQNLGVANILHEKELNADKLKNEINAFYKNIKQYNQAYSKLQPTNGREKAIELIKKY